MTAIKQTAVVGKDGKVELQSIDLPEGATVEVIILHEQPEQDTTAYLLSNPFNRERLLKSIADADNPATHIYVDIDAEKRHL